MLPGAHNAAGRRTGAAAVAAVAVAQAGGAERCGGSSGGGGGGGGGGDGAGAGVVAEHTGFGATSFCVPRLPRGLADALGDAGAAGEPDGAADAAARLALLSDCLRTGPGDGAGAWLLQAAPAAPDAFAALRWRKLGVNSVLNPVAALLGVENGAFAALSRRGAFARQVEALASEATEAADADAGRAPWGSAGALVELARDVAARTARNTNSTLADARAGRCSEAPFINGFVARALAARGRAAPASDAVLAALAARERALLGERAAADGAQRADRIVRAADVWRGFGAAQ